MNLSMEKALSFCQAIHDEISKNSAVENKLVLAPPCIYLSAIQQRFSKICLAAQNVSHIEAEEGAYTGETSAYMLASMNIKYSIIGHYERRKFFSETLEIISKKISNCIKNNILPIICFGEENLGDDVIEPLRSLNIEPSQQIIYAYEPYWAIGSKNFQFSTIEKNLEKISLYLSSKINRQNCKLIYGGSVNSQNINELNSIEGLDGMLVGSASLNQNELFKILESI